MVCTGTNPSQSRTSCTTMNTTTCASKSVAADAAAIDTLERVPMVIKSSNQGDESDDEK